MKDGAEMRSGVGLMLAYPVNPYSHKIWCCESFAKGIHHLRLVGVCDNRIDMV